MGNGVCMPFQPVRESRLCVVADCSEVRECRTNPGIAHRLRGWRESKFLQRVDPLGGSRKGGVRHGKSARSTTSYERPTIRDRRLSIFILVLPSYHEQSLKKRRTWNLGSIRPLTLAFITRGHWLRRSAMSPSRTPSSSLNSVTFGRKLPGTLKVRSVGWFTIVFGRRAVGRRRREMGPTVNKSKYDRE